VLVASIVVVGALGGAFVALMIDVWETNGLVGLDRTAHRLRQAEPVDALLADGQPLGFSDRLRPRTVVELGGPRFVISAAFALAVLALAFRDRIGALVAIGGPGLTGALTEYVLKPLVNVPAPVGSRAFPSGHAGGIAAIALVAVIVVHRRWGWPLAAPVAVVAGAPVLFVGTALLRLDFHYPTDVLGGGLLAATVVLGMTAALALYPGPGHRLLYTRQSDRTDPSVAAIATSRGGARAVTPEGSPDRASSPYP
jgi:membrane-associated phospholipid phosphatase